MNVLIVDDNATNRKLLRLTLEAEGHRTLEAEDGFEALEKLQSTEVDAVISDVLMPKMDGYRFCYEVRRNEELREIPIVIYSSTYTSPADEGLATKVGADCFVRRPAAAATILEALSDAVRSRKSSRRMPAVEELDLLKHYSDRLVIELERRNLELESAQDRLSEAHEALRASERKYRDLVDQAPIGVFQTAPDGSFLSVNAAFAAITGYDSPDEVLRINSREIYFRASGLAMFLNAFDRAARVSGLEVRLKKKNGTPVWVRADGRAVRDSTGQIEHYEVFVADITEQRYAEESLRASEERYRVLMDRAQDAIHVVDASGTVLEANQAAERLSGRSKAEIVGRNFLEMVVPEEREEVRRRFEASLQRGGAQADETRVLRPDGTIVPIEISASVIEIGGRPLVLAIIRDISEQNALAEQLRLSQKMEAVGQLAGGVAHDFNNLLTAILGYSQLLAPDLRKNPDHFSAIEEIRKAGERAASLTRQLLAFSRKQMLEPRILDLNEVVRHIEEMLSRLIGEDVRFVVKLDPQLGSIRADAGQVEQVIMNLAVNARDAMPRGGQLSIETANVELDEEYAQTHVHVPPGPYAMLAVSDTGVGMDDATKRRIFEPFFTTKEKGRGTGLGLSTVYGIVKQSGGYIWVYSEPGKGTAFKAYFPRVDKPAEPLPTDRAGAPAGGTETVLLVEDEDAVRALARRILETKGYRVLEASDGARAFEIVRAHSGPIDLLLTDVVLPGAGGSEIAARIRELFPRVKVLYSSGYTDDGIVRRGLTERDSAFLEKPFTPNALARKVREVLDS
jgi:PAS domain S-box-containing protein